MAGGRFVWNGFMCVRQAGVVDYEFGTQPNDSASHAAAFFISKSNKTQIIVMYGILCFSSNWSQLIDSVYLESLLFLSFLFMTQRHVSLLIDTILSPRITLERQRKITLFKMLISDIWSQLNSVVFIESQPRSVVIHRRFQNVEQCGEFWMKNITEFKRVFMLGLLCSLFSDLLQLHIRPTGRELEEFLFLINNSTKKNIVRQQV